MAESKVNSYNVGDRVMLIPFQHKGKIATVRYIGSIAKKFGTWVGLELDEPTGDSSGDFNNEKLFECAENHGLVLRNTQIRLYNPDADTSMVGGRPAPLATSRRTDIPRRGPALEIDPDAENNGLSNSPLLTTKGNDDSAKTLHDKIDAFIDQKKPAQPEDQPATDSKTGGWQERLARLKQKKIEEKKIVEVTPAGQDIDEATQGIRDSFAPASGIQKDTTGKMVVNQEQVKKSEKPDGEAILKQIEEKKVQEEIKQAAAQEEEKKAPASPKAASVKPTAATASVKATPARPGHNRVPSKAELIKEKQEKLAAERANKTTAAKVGAASGRATMVAKAAGSSLNQSLNKNTRASMLNTTQKLQKKTTGTEEATTPGMRRETSSSRLGIRKEDSDAAKPGMARQNSSSRLGIGERGSVGVGARAGSNTRAGLTTRNTTTGTAATRTSASKEKQNLNSTLTKKVGAGLNSTLRKQTTPMQDRPGTAQGSAAKPSTAGRMTTTTARPGVGTAAGQIEMQKMKDQLNEKNTEIQCLKEEIDKMKERITELQESSKGSEDQLLQAHKAELQKLQDEAAETKLKYQTDLENFQERMMNTSSTSQQQDLINEKQIEQIKAQVQQEEQEKRQQIEGELNELKTEMQEKNEQIKQLQEQVSSLTSDLEQKISSHTEQVSSLEEQLQNSSVSRQLETTVESDTSLVSKEQLQKHQDELAALQAQLLAAQETSAAAQKAAQQAQEQSQTQQKELEAKNQKELAALQKKVDDQAQEISKFDEQRAADDELHDLELAELQEKNDELIEKLKEQGQVQDEDPLADLGLEEIKAQNKQLRQAIVSQKYMYEEEKKTLEAQFKADNTKDLKIADLEQRLSEMDFLLDEADKLETEKADLQEKLESMNEYEKMVEEMVEEIARKDDEQEDFVAKHAELQEEARLMEELSNQMETYNKELQQEIDERNQQVDGLKEEVEQLNFIIIEQDARNEQYKEKIQDQKKHIKIAQDQLQEYTSTDQKDQTALLLEKQNNLLRMLRESEAKLLQVARNQIGLWQGRSYADLVLQVLPGQLQSEAQLVSYQKVQNLNQLRHKATLFIREVCDKSLDEAPHTYEEPDQLQKYITLLQQICEIMLMIVNKSSIIQFQLANMEPEQYSEVMINQNSMWERCPALGSQIDSLTDLLNNQSLSYTFDVADILAEVKNLDTLSVRVEKVFISVAPEEKALAEAQGLQEYQIEEGIAFQRRRNLAQNEVAKLKLRHACVQMAVGVQFVAYYSQKQPEARAVANKCKLIYQRLIDTVIKLDYIPNEEEGDDYIDTKQLNTELRLQQKLEMIQVLWQSDAAPEALEEQRQKSWLGTLEAIERDITTLNNDFKYKRLVKSVEAKYNNQKIDHSDLYKMDYQASGPWMKIANKIKAELQNMSVLKQKNNQLMDKHKDSLKEIIKIKKEKEEALLIHKGLDTKLSTALARAEMVPAIEIEKKELQGKVASVSKQLDQQKQDSEKQGKEIQDLKKKLEDEKKKAAERPVVEQVAQQPPTPQGSGRPNIKARQINSKHSSKQSRANHYFTTLQNSSMNKTPGDQSASHSRQQSMQNTTKMMEQLQNNEDVYMSIIQELQYDRMRLKGKDMTQRIAKLQQEGSCFSTLMKSFNQVEVRLNQDESNLVTGAINEVSKLRHGMKRQMAKARVVDLTKKEEAPVAKKVEHEFDQQIQKAKNVVTETVDLLFSKKTGFKSIAAASADSQKENNEQDNKQAKSSNLSEIKIGEIKLRGKIQLPQRKVIVDSQQMSDMRRNLALFSC